MLTWSKLLLAGLAATFCMVVTVGVAPANKLSISSRTFRLVWSALRFEEEGATLTCKVTLEGSFHSSTVHKVASATIGYVSRGSGGTCTGDGEGVTVAQETLPWGVTYESFSGTLPNITTVQFGMDRNRVFLPLGGQVCLYLRSRGALELTIGAGGAVSAVQTGPTIAWVLVVGRAPPCRIRIRTIGASTASVLGTTTGFSVRLI